jgi:hypothetical protein
MNDLKDLVLAVYTGQRSIDSLSDEESAAVILGLQQVAEFLSNNENTTELAAAMQTILNKEDDPFEQAIVAAESRGSTYWEFENDRLH